MRNEINKQASQKKRGPGRPATGHDPVTAIRLSPELRMRVDQWGADRGLGRSEAIRALIEQGLKK